MAEKIPLKLLNGETATFECIYGRGCEGKCCQNGRPALTPEEQSRIEKNLHKILPLATPAVRKIFQAAGIVTRRTRNGLPIVPVKDGWCAFFNEGCILHKAGAMEGDAYRYKPRQCSIFPLLWDDAGNWYVRQKGYQNETWDELFCLDPKHSAKMATETLAQEIEMATKLKVA